MISWFNHLIVKLIQYSDIFKCNILQTLPSKKFLDCIITISIDIEK